MDKIKENIDSIGFYRIKNIFSENEIISCESIITSMMEKKGFLLDFLKEDMSDVPCITKNQQMELVRPTILSSKLRKSQIFRRCHLIAKEYFGGSAYYLFDHAIYKMPNTQTITPWHQDQAYLGSDIIIPSLHFWIPFQDTDANNGAMQFSKNYHDKILPHELAYSGNPHILKVIDEPIDNIYSMSIRRGDISLHTNFTLHSATSNKSNNSRKAWIIHFGQKPEWYKRWLKIKKITENKLQFFN